MMKFVALLALVAVASAAPGNIIATAGILPASTAPLGLPLAYGYGFQQAPIAVAAPAPITYAAPAVVHAAPVAVPAPVAYTSGVKITHVHEPVEQHGYQIAY